MFKKPRQKPGPVRHINLGAQTPTHAEKGITRMPLDNSVKVVPFQLPPTNQDDLWPPHWKFDPTRRLQTVVCTSPHELDANGAIIVPFPGPTRAEIEELRALANDKSYTQDDRQQFSQIANIMETAKAERPEPAGNGADDEYIAPGEPSAREDISPENSEDRLALRFADRHGSGLRYVAAWGKWLTWGACWKIENTLLAFHMAREICREAAAECNRLPESKAIAKAKTVVAVENLARSDRRIAATVNQWNADQSFFNCKRKIGNVN
jgi:D5 N terminal like